MRTLTWDADRVQGWVDRFEAVMAGHVPWRAEAHRLALDLLRASGATESVLDLGCGAGSLSRWLVDQAPTASVTALDWDPAMATLAAAHLHGRVLVREQDLTAPGWGTTGWAACSAAVSSSVLHMVGVAGYGRVAREVAAAVAPGGLFVDIDELPVEPGGRLADVCATLRGRALEAHLAHGGESYQQWITALCAEPGMGPAAALRQERFAGRAEEVPASLAQRTAALLTAGFREVAVVERRLDVAVLVALR